MCNNVFHIVVCGSIVPDPLQTLEPIQSPSGVPSLKNEMMLPHILDPFATHALFEAASLIKKFPSSKIWLITMGARAKLQQVMMTIAQKAPFELVAIDGPSTGFSNSVEISAYLEEAINGIVGIDKSKMLLFGGWESASRGSGTTMQILGERLAIKNQFQAVDNLDIKDNGSIEVLERVDGGRHQLSLCNSLPAVFTWATGFLPEPPNNPQVGMMNMRTIMPSLGKALKKTVNNNYFKSAKLPEKIKQTKIVKDIPLEQMAEEIVNWIKTR